MNRKTLSDQLIDRISKDGIDKIFGVTGGGIMYLVDSISRSKYVKLICTHHEEYAGVAAATPAYSSWCVQINFTYFERLIESTRYIIPPPVTPKILSIPSFEILSINWSESVFLFKSVASLFVAEFDYFRYLSIQHILCELTQDMLNAEISEIIKFCNKERGN